MKTIFTLSLVLLASYMGSAQKKLIQPKVATNIESVDKFVTAAFDIYNTVYDFHYGTGNSASLSNMEEEEDFDEEAFDESEMDSENNERDEFQILDESINQLIESTPEILEEIDSHSVAKQLKATLSLNRAIKALKQSGKLVKTQLTGN